MSSIVVYVWYVLIYRYLGGNDALGRHCNALGQSKDTLGYATLLYLFFLLSDLLYHILPVVAAGGCSNIWLESEQQVLHSLCCIVLMTRQLSTS